MKKYYALTDNDHIVYLGEHKDFFDADECEIASKHNIVWIFDADIMREWVADIKRQTPEELQGTAMRTIRKMFSTKCCECGEVHVWFWKRRCSFCDSGEGEVQ